MGELFVLFILAALALIATLVLRHLFNIKYPEVDSAFIILLPIMQIACMIGFFTCFYGLTIIASCDYYLGSHYVSISDTADTLLAIHSLFTMVGGMLMIITAPLLLYYTFNFPKYKSKRLIILASINTICVIFTDITGIIAYAFFPEFMLCVVFFLMLVTILFLHIKYKHAVKEIYRSKYTNSIQSVVVKSLTQLASEKTESTKRCPYCGEEILAVAKKCKHCGEWLNKETI